MRKSLVTVAVAVLMLGWSSTRAMAVCGDGTVDAGEDCDLGGTCIGGPAAGMACHVGDATCTGGGTCTTFGGKGCAANCTIEHDVPFPLVPGELNGLNVAPGTSGVAILSDFLSIPLPLGTVCNSGDNASFPCANDNDCPAGRCVASQQTLTIGKMKDGKIPVVVKAASAQYPGVPVSTLGCGCIHGVAAKTCGGTLVEPDGTTLSPNCTPGFSDGDSVCAGKAPCAFVHGEGNTASGVIGCDGLDGVDLLYEQDSGGSSDACAASNTCPAHVVLSGHGGPGSAQIAQTLGITYIHGGCIGSDPRAYGADGIFCTADDFGVGAIAVASTLPMVTGTATAVVHNANGTAGADLGPVVAVGAPFNCYALECGDLSSAAGAGLVGAFTFVHLDTVGDGAVTAQLFGDGEVTDPTRCEPTPSCEGCAGDCDASGGVSINDIIIMVNITLGHAQPSACPSGIIPCDAVVDITMILRAVNNALSQCPQA